MAVLIRKTEPHAAEFAAAILVLAKRIGEATNPHLDAAEYYSAAKAAANATNLPTALTLVNELRAVSLVHRADTFSHKIADVATITAPAATDLATAETLANELKSDYATHAASAAIHYNADVTNAITASNATDLGTLVTLVNDIKAQFIAHFALAATGSLVRAVSA